MDFDNKVVFISGSGSGIGQATAILFAKEGADVAIVDYNEDSANNTAEKCKAFGRRVLVIKADVSIDEEAKAAIEKIIHEFGKLDVLINNAGFSRQGNLLNGTIMDTYDEVLNTNLRAVVVMTSLATPHLVNSKGCIVNTSSVIANATRLGVWLPAYTISKVGVDCFTRISALELATAGVRVNAVSPGPVNTNIVLNSRASITMDEFIAETALKKMSEPQEIAGLILFLASDKAKSITGSVYFMDNGMSLL